MLTCDGVFPAPIVMSLLQVFEKQRLDRRASTRTGRKKFLR